MHSAERAVSPSTTMISELRTVKSTRSPERPEEDRCRQGHVRPDSNQLLRPETEQPWLVPTRYTYCYGYTNDLWRNSSRYAGRSARRVACRPYGVGVMGRPDAAGAQRVHLLGRGRQATENQATPHPTNLR